MVADVIGLLGIVAAAYGIGLIVYLFSSWYYNADDQGYARAWTVDGPLSRYFYRGLPLEDRRPQYVAYRREFETQLASRLNRYELAASIAMYVSSRAVLPPLGSFALSCLVSIGFSSGLAYATRYSAWERQIDSKVERLNEQRTARERQDQAERHRVEARATAERRQAEERAAEERRKAEEETIRRAREIRAQHRRQQELQRAEAIVRAHDEGRLDDFERERDYPTNWPSIREAVLTRDGYKCANCGDHASPIVTLHVHHVVPLSLGGTNNVTNLTTLCERCHKSLHPHMR